MRQDQLDKKLAAMKDEYERIQVPEEALLRVKVGIAQGKREAERETKQEAKQETKQEAKQETKQETRQEITQKMRQETGAQGICLPQKRKQSERKGKKLMRFMKTSGMTAAAAVLAITVLTNLNPTIANAMEQIPVIGSIARVVTFRTYENQTNQFEANIQVPQIAQDGTDLAALAANKSIDEYASQLIDMYEKELAESNGEGHYSLDSSYKVVADTEQYLSIQINTTLAMASGTQYVKVFTIEKATGQVVTLSQALSNDPARLQAVSDNIKAQMEAQIQEDPNKSYFLNSDIPETNFTGITGEESYYRDKDGNLVILFDEYEVAPGYMGAVEFTVPASVAFPGE